MANDETFYAVSNIVEVLRDIAKQTRYTYLQTTGDTIRIDNQTGESWRLVWEWDDTIGDSRPKWERWTIREEEAAPEEPAETPTDALTQFVAAVPTEGDLPF